MAGSNTYTITLASSTATVQADTFAVTPDGSSVIFTTAGNAQALYKLTDVTDVLAESPAATPTFTPGGGFYSTPQTVTIACSTSASTIYYTTDGTPPTIDSTLYTAPITVTPPTTVLAIAVATGYAQSVTGVAAYQSF